MAVTKLDIFNLALGLLGDQRLVTDADDLEARYALDNVWDRAVEAVFHASYWRFAMLTVSLSHNGALVAMPGYSSRFALPATFYRAHAIFVLSDTRECPVDVRQQGAVLHSTLSPINLRYVDSALIDDLDEWPIPVVNVVARYLAYLIAERIHGDPGKARDMLAIYQAYLAEAQRAEAVPVDPWLIHQLAGEFKPAVRFILEQGFWLFSLKSSSISSSVGETLPDYAYGASKPADWLKTQALFIPANGRERPLDIKEHGTRWSMEAASFTVRYLSNVGYDSTKWPDEFRSVVEAYLGARNPVTDDQGRTSAPPWVELLKSALMNITIPESPWLKHQLSGSFDPARRYILEQGFWTFALKDQAMTNSAGTILPGYTYGFSKPADWLRTNALFTQDSNRELPFDVKEHGLRWSSDVSSFTVRYLSKDGITASLWPDEFAAVVEAYLAARDPVTDEQGNTQRPQWVPLLHAAMSNIAIPENPWLRHQLSGRFDKAVRAALEEGFWKFAIKTVEIDANNDTPSTSYSYAFDKPADWLRTYEIYDNTWRRDGRDYDYRDEGDAFHAMTSPITLRYVSTDGLNPAKWSAKFEQAILAELQAAAAVETPGTAGAVVQALDMVAERQMKQARQKDDARERPLINEPSRFVGGRFGFGWGRSTEQGR